jgi:release factor glutamine methyltransferase
VTLDEATRLLAEAGIDNPRAEARLLLAHALGVTREQTLAAAPTPNQSAKFDALIARRTGREPFAYITGHKEFWSLDFEVGPGVLVPRPDTETLIEEALRLAPDRSAPLRIADLGTGSGAILTAALTEFPNARGIGFESSPPAFACSNPPYIPSADIESLEPEVSQFEPRPALDGGPDGLAAYRALAGLLPRLLAQGGHALLEIGLGQAQPMGTLFQGLEILRLAPDLSGIPRCVILRNP